MMKKMILLFLLIFYITGCSPNQSSNLPVTSDRLITEAEPSKEEQEYLSIFQKDYDESSTEILKTYYFDFDNNNRKELIIFFWDLKNKTYSNVAIVTDNGIYKIGLDATNKNRFLKPIESKIINKNLSKNEIQVKLQNSDSQEKLNYYLEMERTSEMEVSVIIRSEQMK